MNRILLLFAVFFCSVLLAESQKVDSVIVEQTGDLIFIKRKAGQ